jgi:hypothetical protein
MYEGRSLWIPTSQISYLSGTLCSSDTGNVKIVTPYFDREMNPRIGGPDFDSRPNQEILLFSIASKLFLERTQHPAYWILGISCRCLTWRLIFIWCRGWEHMELYLCPSYMPSSFKQGQFYFFLLFTYFHVEGTPSFWQIVKICIDMFVSAVLYACNNDV